MDHKKIKFAIPYFKCYDCQQHAGTICSDFEPAAWCINAVKEWRGFDEYWANYVDQWLPYSDTNTYMSFTLNNDTSVRYHVKLLDYVYGKMIDDNGRLKAFEKIYYKQSRDPTSFGYVLIREPIDGIEVP